MPAGAMTNSQSKKSRDIEAVSTASTDLRAMPRDAGGFVYAIMFFQGVGQLFPWNAFITAASESNHTPLSKKAVTMEHLSGSRCSSHFYSQYLRLSRRVWVFAASSRGWVRHSLAPQRAGDSALVRPGRMVALP